MPLNPRIQIRPATLADVPTLVTFNCRLALESEHKTLDPAIVSAGVIALVNDPESRGFYFVATDGENGPMVGQLQITREWSDWRNGWFWWLQSVYVHADYRRQGIFSPLVNAMKAQAKLDPSVLGLRLYVEHDNLDAQRTYERLGMEAIPFRLYQQYPLD